MHYGVYLSTVNEFSDPLLLADLAYQAELAGWDGVFIWDHISQPSAVVDPWVTLAAIAMRTQRVKIGTVVTPVARRRPWKLARETATLDRLCGGRLILGVGLGHSRAEFEQFAESGDPRIRAERLDEGLAILDGLWSGEEFSFSGKHYHIQDVQMLPTPVQQPRIPIWPCGAWTRKRAPFRRAARWDGIVAIADPKQNRAISPDEIVEIQKYITKHRSNDEPFDIVVILWSEGDASDEEKSEVLMYAQSGVTWWLEDVSTERFRTIEQVRDRIDKGPPGQ